jgi:hypothetical protein
LPKRATATVQVRQNAYAEGCAHKLQATGGLWVATSFDPFLRAMLSSLATHS